RRRAARWGGGGASSSASRRAVRRQGGARTLRAGEDRPARRLAASAAADESGRHVARERTAHVKEWRVGPQVPGEVERLAAGIEGDDGVVRATERRPAGGNVRGGRGMWPGAPGARAAPAAG